MSEEQQLSVRKKRINGNAHFSLFSGDKSLIDDEEMPRIAAEIVKTFPEITKKVIETYVAGMGTNVEELNLSGLEPSQRTTLVGLIAKKTKFLSV